MKRYRAFLEEAADLVASHGGSLSGEHGDGQGRAELLPRMFGEELCRAFQDFKTIWDPDGRMNPGKVVDPLPLDADLRMRTPLREPDFSPCVGVGRCRRDSGGVMCPSWQVTREEKHSTRGRARLLFEMLSGEVIADGWRSEEVHEALDLCLSCKGCKSDCPAGVDMAAYKAEFLHRYYQGRRRPNHAYAVGLIHRWARLASLAPGLANRLGRTATLKRLAGIDSRRSLPAFAPRTFRSWFARHKSPEGPEVLLWPDTFTNHFQPEIGIAAVRVLESAGFKVTLPRAGLCCGRPLYDVGLLDLARRQSQEILDALPKGVPMVGLEPSCVTVFRDEMGGAVRMLTLSELLETMPPLQSPVLVQPHCHHHAVMGLAADRRLLGADARFLEGCCGMAGGFGFRHYDVSMACAERVLLPALREEPDAVLLADGFSCREQILQATGRRALHLAELLAR